MTSLWHRLPKPIFSLAPMEDVTDTVFRQIICTTGKPDVFFTEFTNVDGVASVGHDVVARRLQYTEIEHPIIAQIWGMVPENYYKVAKELVERGFDGIDINMGCPQHDVTLHGACSALIKNHALAKEIIQATKEGVRDASHPPDVKRPHPNPLLKGEGIKKEENIPVSVKTRIGFKNIQTEEWIGFLLEQDLAVITVHGRTAAEMSKVPCHWDEIGKAVRLRDEWEKKYSNSQINKYTNNISQSASHPRGVNTQQLSSLKNLTPNPPALVKQAASFTSFNPALSGEGDHGGASHTLIMGNGDVQSLQEAREKVQEY